MPLNELKFNKSTNGLGKQNISNDGISALVFYNDTLPSGFSTTDNIKAVFSLGQAEELGIIAASFPLIHYQVDEFFRGNSEQKLYILIADVPVAAYDFEEVTTVVNFSNSEVKLVGVFADALVFDVAQITTLNSVATELYNQFKPVSILYGADYTALDYTTIPTALVSAPYVTPVFVQSGSGVGLTLFTSLSKSIPSVGLSLGILSSAKVSECIGWIKKFNISNGIELESPALCTGELTKNLTDTALGNLKDKGYLIARKYTGIGGSYFTDSLTSDIATSDYSTIENVRTIHKAILNTRNVVLPELMSPLEQIDGQLTAPSIAKFEVLCSQALDSMIFDEELSKYEVLIDPKQDVLASSKLQITLKLQPKAVARMIEINIGFTK